MEDIQIYYIATPSIISNLKKQHIELDPLVRLGNKTFEELKNIINTSQEFCRDEKSITVNHLVNSLSSNFVLYAEKNNEVLGVLIFMFNETRSGDKFINFDGICSPKMYSGLGIGHNLIDMLIRIGKFNGINYIKLECKGNIMNYYKKLGFVISEQKITYDSDEDSDDEGEPYYYMTLDLLTASGGKRKRKTKQNKTKKNKKSKKSKRKQTRKR